MTEVQRIRTEGHLARPRNRERVWLEVVAVPANGATIEGHFVRGPLAREGKLVPQPVRIEVYEDRVAAVLARTRTEAHAEAYRKACEVNDHLRAEWIREHKAQVDAQAPHEREQWIDLNCNLRPEQHLVMYGFRDGLPPLESCKVVHPHDERTIDAREWMKLDASKRREWLVDAPTTPENAAHRAGEHIADQIARAIELANRSGGGKR